MAKAKDKRRAKSIRMTEDVRKRYDELVAEEGMDQSELIDKMIDAYRNRSNSTRSDPLSENAETKRGELSAYSEQIEALNHKVDAVSTKITGLSELMKDTANTISPDDVEAMYPAMLEDAAGIRNSIDLMKDTIIEAINSMNNRIEEIDDNTGNALSSAMSELKALSDAIDIDRIREANGERCGSISDDAQIYSEEVYQKVLPALRALHKDHIGLKILLQKASYTETNSISGLCDVVDRVYASMKRIEKSLDKGSRYNDDILLLKRDNQNKDKIIDIKDQFIENLQKEIGRLNCEFKTGIC